MTMLGPPAAIAISCPGPTGPAGAAGPAGPTGSVQFNLDGINLGGSTGAGIAPSDGVLIVGLENGGPIPVTGNLRYVGGPLDTGGFIARFRSDRTVPSNEQDIGFYYCYSTTASDFSGETTVIGRGGWNDGSFPLVYQPTLCPDEIIDAANGGWEFLFTQPTPDNNQNGLFAFQVDRPADPVGSFPFARMFLIERYTNLMIGPVNFASIENALCHGETVVVWGQAQVVPTTNPAAGQICAYVDPTETLPYARTPGSDVVPMFAKSAASELTSDSSTSSGSFADLLTVTISTESGIVDVLATAAGTTLVHAGIFRILVDGVAAANGGGNIAAAVTGSMAIAKRVTGLSPGSHTFKLQWRTSAGGTLSISPVANVDSEHATLTVTPSS